MTSFEYLPIPAADLDRIRCNGHDDHGNAFTAISASGGEPLRCCLTLAVEGASIALISYQPSALGGPYAEIGPVFVHLGDCGGPASVSEFPADLRDRNAVVRGYDAEGRQVDGVLVRGGEGETALKGLFEDGRIVLVHHRNVVAGCWNFSIRRAA
jgi:hypothetical protein